MGKVLGRLALGFLAVVVVAFLIWDWNWFRGMAEDEASAASGRETTIADLDVDWDWDWDAPRIILSDVHLANPDWATGDDMVSAQRIEIVVKLWDSIFGALELPELVFDQPVVALEKDGSGQANWIFGGNLAADAAAETMPEDRGDMPRIGSLIIRAGELSYVDPARQIDLSSTIETVTGGTDEGSVALSGEGTFEGRPFTLDVTGGSLLTLRDEADPYPLSIQAAVGATTMQAEGTVTRPFALAGLNTTFKIAGNDMAEVFPIFGIPLPPTKPYSLAGVLDHVGNIWSFTGFSGVVGESDLNGDLRIDVGPDPAYMEADLNASNLDFADLSGFIGVDPDGETPVKESGRLLPDTPVDLERLRAMNMDVHFVADQIITPGYALSDMDATLSLQDGLALVDPVRFGIAGGYMAGTLRLDGREDIPAAGADLTIGQVALKDFFAGSQFVQEMGGRLDGRIGLDGRGASLADILATSDGRTALIMTEGTISAIMVELAGLDIAETLSLAITEGDTKVAIDCAAIDLVIAQGVGTTKTFLLNTADSFVAGQGTVDLTTETVDLVVQSDTKDFSLLSLNAPIYLEGPLADPSIDVGAEVVIPKIDWGDPEQGNALCDSLREALR